MMSRSLQKIIEEEGVGPGRVALGLWPAEMQGEDEKTCRDCGRGKWNMAYLGGWGGVP